MIYYTNETYMERVSSTFFKHLDGKLDSQTAVFNLKYMNASTYCDVRAATMNASAAFYRNEDMSFYDSKLKQHRQYFYDQIAPGMKQYGMNLDWLEMTAAQRVYTYEAEGETWAICIMAEVRGYQYTLRGYSKEVSIIWDVPNGYYMMICPLASYQRLHDTVFTAFVENTAVSDQFVALQDELTYKIRDDVKKNMNMAVARSMAYAAAMDAMHTASVNSYLQSSSYSSVDRFTDYIFDQNTYTTSDGYEVSISTSYDYVWEGSNGTVYCSNSAHICS